MNFPEREICTITAYRIKEEILKISKLFIQFKMLAKEQDKINKTESGFFKKTNFVAIAENIYDKSRASCNGRK